MIPCPDRPLRSCVGVGLAAAVLLLAACAEDVPEPEPTLRPVRTAPVAVVDGRQPVTLAGVARAGLESRLSFRVGGTLARLDVELGDTVRRGAVLARLDPADFELSLEEAEASLAQATASERRAQSDYSRVRALYENNNAAKSELDAARAQAESATAQVEAGEKRVEQARRQLGYTALRAPADGAIARLAVEVNENISPGQEIVLLSGGARPEVVVGVPEIAIAQVREGQTVEIRFDALPGRTFQGQVSEVGVATAGASTYDVVAELIDPAVEIRSGMAADVAFQLALGSGAGLAERRVVPLVAVGEDGDGQFVFVLERGTDGTGTVRRRPVQSGELLAGGLEVLDGVAAGEEVVTAGVRRLVDGMTVAVLAESALKETASTENPG